MTSSALMVVLRLVHIVAGAAWVDSALILMLFVIPVTLRNGIEGSRFLPRIVQRGLVQWLASLSGVTVLADRQLVTGGRIAGLLLLVSTAAMAAARYV